MRTWRMSSALPLALLLAGCGVASSPRTAPSPLTLAPGARAPGASLFGTDVVGLPNGLTLTADAAPGSSLLDLDPHLPRAAAFRAGAAVTTALSPDGRTLLVLTSGYNRLFDTDGRRVEPGSSEYVFVYDVTAGAPREAQVLYVPNAFGGLAFDPRGGRFYVGGGSDDVLRGYSLGGDGRWIEDAVTVALGHLDRKGDGGLGVEESPYAAGVAVSPSGALVAVANHENDTLSLVDAGSPSRRVVAEVRLAPGRGAVGGEFPSSVLFVGETRAFVTCQRDREVVEVDVQAKAVVRRIKVGGQPTRIIANRAGTRLYVANANSDTVSAIDTSRGEVVGVLPTAAPLGDASASLVALRGSNPNALALSPDERTLYVTNGGNSTLAVIALDESKRGGGEVVGLVPTGFYPNAVTLSADGRRAFVAHGKSPTGPNPFGPWSPIERVDARPTSPRSGNQFALQLTRGGLLSFPLPDAATLRRLTAQSLANNRAVAPPVPPRLAALTAHAGPVKHVIYVIGENRTYDQILGDLPGSDGDAGLVHWGGRITPNQHALATEFVAFDRFFDSGGVSGDGWQWSTSGRTTDVAEKAIPVQYAERGHHSYDWEGTNRNVNVGLPTLSERLSMNPNTPRDPDLLPGTGDVGAVDGPAEGGRGFLWDAALTAGLSFRNYGCFVDGTRYDLPGTDPARIPPTAMPALTQTRVAFPTRVALQATTDPYYRGFDMDFADGRRVDEWAREFDAYVASGDLPALETVRLPHDHLGSFGTARDGLTTPDTQIADHDYALGRVVEKVSRSPYWESTVIVALEDDAQNGSDHVDAHRSVLFVAGGHVARHAKVSTPYTTVSVLRTIELLLGLPPLGQFDGVAPPLDVFTEEVDRSPFTAQVPAVLRSTTLPLPAAGPGEHAARPRGDRASWAAATVGLDFRKEDAVPTEAFNRIVACGLGVRAECSRPATTPAASARPDPDDD